MFRSAPQQPTPSQARSQRAMASIAIAINGIIQLWVLSTLLRFTRYGIGGGHALFVVGQLAVTIGIPTYLIIRSLRRRRLSAGLTATSPLDEARPWFGRRVAGVLGNVGVTPQMVIVLVVMVFIAGSIASVVFRLYDGMQEMAEYYGDDDLLKPAATMLLGQLALVALVGVGAAVGSIVVVRRAMVRAEEAVETLPAAPPSPGALDALHRVSIAAGIAPPSLGVVEHPGVNALVFGRPGGQAKVLVTRGALNALTTDQLAVVFANLIARLEMGVPRASLNGDGLERIIGPRDLAEVNAAADARTLVLVRDAATVLATMDAVARHSRRMPLDVQVSPACFYCWPHEPPPVDMPDRIQHAITLAGTAGREWWRADRERRRLQAAADLGIS